MSRTKTYGVKAGGGYDYIELMMLPVFSDDPVSDDLLDGVPHKLDVWSVE